MAKINEEVSEVQSLDNISLRDYKRLYIYRDNISLISLDNIS